MAAEALPLKVYVALSWTGKYLHIRGAGRRSLCGFELKGDVRCVELSDERVCPRCRGLFLKRLKDALAILQILESACTGGANYAFEELKRSGTDRKV